MDIRLIRSARSLFYLEAGIGWSVVSKFTSLTTEFPRSGPEGNRFDEDFIRNQLLFATHDLWMMCTGLARVAWMKERAANDELLRGNWRSYASLDIENWHTQFRSLLDYVAKVIWELAERRRQIADKFTRLWEQASGNSSDPQGLQEKLGGDWLELVKSATWYSQILSIRDETVHRGAQTMVLGEPSDGILFQVAGKGRVRLVREEPILAFNSNAVYFERYAAYFMGCLLTWLEEFADLAYKRLGMAQCPGSINHHFGWEVLVTWLDALIAQADQP